MSARLIRPADHRIVPWRNGGGRTAEIAVAPADGPLGFLWRISMADVEQDGPFSSFPGCDRVLLLLLGAGIVLTFGDGEVRHLTHGDEPLSFAGDRPVDCRLVDGPVRDLNVMVDRAGVAVRCRILSAPGTHSLPAADVRCLYLLAGSARCDAAVLSAGDSLLLERAGCTLSLPAGAIAYDMEITLRAASQQDPQQTAVR